MPQTYNENIELHTLAILMQDGSLYPVTEDLLEKSSFGWKPFGIVYQSFVDIVESDLYPDLETICVDLDRKNLLEAISIPSNGMKGREALEYIANLSVNADMIESYAHQINELRGNRQIIELAEKMKKHVESGKRPIETLYMMDLESGKISAYVGAQTKNTRTAKDVAISNLEQYEKVAKGESLYIATGLDAWDDYVGGLFPRLYMIAAEQGEGKSSLVLNLINNIAIQSPKDIQNWKKTKIKLFTFESSAEEINNKLVQMRTGISQIDIEKGKLSDNQIVQYQSALQEIAESPILYDDSSEITLPLLRTKIRKAVADGAKIIFIDQLEQISLGNSGDNQQEHIRLNYITYRIKAYSREQNVPIVLVHQRKKVDNTKLYHNQQVNRDPELNDLNQAGGKSPDAVLMLRTRKDPAFFWVKNRQGARGKREVNWDGSRIRFTDKDGFHNMNELTQEELFAEIG